MPNDEDENVVPLPVKPTEIRPQGDLPFRLIVNRTGDYCAHRGKMVDDNRRTVTCKECKAVLDPFTVLLEVARHHERFDHDLQRLKIEIRAANSRLELLKRLEYNARARAKRLGIRVRGNFEAVVDYARKTLSRPDLTDWQVDYMLEGRSPENRIRAGLEALERGHQAAGLELMRTAIAELDVAHELVQEERKHA